MWKTNGMCPQSSIKLSYNIKRKLEKLLSSVSDKISFEDLANEYRRLFNSTLQIHFTNDLNIFLESERESDSLESADDLESNSELQSLIGKIVFTSEMYNNMLKGEDNYVNSSVSSSSEDNLEVKYKKMTTCRSNNDDKSSMLLEEDPLIQNCFDRRKWAAGDIFFVYLQNVYDPSKFWINVVQIDFFQKFLFNFYEKHAEDYKVKREDIREGLNCVVFYSSSNLYYRARVVRTDLQNGNQFKVYLYDFGMGNVVNVAQIFHLDQQFYEIASFAVRTTLANISSVDNEMWTTDVIKRFHELTKGKRLVAQVVRVNTSRKILEINLGDIHSKGTITFINQILINEKLAKYAWQAPVIKPKNTLFKPNSACLYLFPTFEVIENALVPLEVSTSENLKKVMSWDVLYASCYSYHQQINDEDE